MLKVNTNGSRVYLTGLVFFLVASIFGHTYAPIPSQVRYAFLGAAIFLIVFKIVVLGTTFRARTSSIIGLILIGLFIVISAISAINARVIYPVTTALLIIGAKDVNFDKIVKTFVVTATAVMISTFLFYLLGLANGVVQIRDGYVRHTFGYRGPTDLAAMVSFILMADLYLGSKKNRPIWYRILGYLFFSVFFWYESNARLGSLTILILVPVSILIKYGQKFMLNSSLFKFIFKFSFTICSLISIWIIQSYISNPGSNFLINLDSLTSYRLTLTVMAVKLYGYSILGNDIYTSYFSVNSNYFYVDSSFYIFLLEYGIILMIIVAIGYYWFVRKELKNKEILILDLE